MSAPSSVTGRPPVLLSTADWFGTLAAVRELAQRGVSVYVASSRWMSQARWSRYARRRLCCPNENDLDAYARWLLSLGEAYPGLALCRTSDNTAWIHARDRDVLQRHSLRLADPPPESIRELLDKSRLHGHARAVGLETPATLFPVHGREAAELALTMRSPVLIKQRTQVSSRTLTKGALLPEGVSVEAAFEAFRSQNTFAASLVNAWPGADAPMLQEYLPAAASRIYCLSGFLTRDGMSWATRAATKVLSHPRHLGIGVMFEHAEVIPELERAVLDLCKRVAYRGIFQCEFLQVSGRHLLIDFNPRFYNYMAFDHARGLPQAWFAYLESIGAEDELAAEIKRARVAPPLARQTAYRYRVGAWLQLFFERLARTQPQAETLRWREWTLRTSIAVDPVWDAGDRVPFIADLVNHVWSALRHPRAFVRHNSGRAT